MMFRKIQCLNIREGDETPTQGLEEKKVIYHFLTVDFLVFEEDDVNRKKTIKTLTNKTEKIRNKFSFFESMS